MAILAAVSAAKEGMEAQKDAAGKPGGNQAGGGFNQITPSAEGQMVDSGGGIPDVSAGLGAALEGGMNAVPKSGGGYGLLDMGGSQVPYSPGLAGRRVTPLQETIDQGIKTGETKPADPGSFVLTEEMNTAGLSPSQEPVDPAAPNEPIPGGGEMPPDTSGGGTDPTTSTGPSKWEKAAIAANIASSLLNTKGPALPGGGRGFTNIDPVALRFILQQQGRRS